MRARHVITVLAIALIWPATGHSQQTAEELFQAGLYQEEALGDLEGAIQLYRQLVDEHPDNRGVAAKAQLHIGLCYEKLGLNEARQAYRSVIDDFPEQRPEVAAARERLASLAQELDELRSGPTFRKIEIASKPVNGVLSPDGTKLTFVSEGGLWVVPLHGNVGPDIAGEPVRIAEVPNAWDLGSLFSWSADGEWIAVNSWSSGDDDVDVYVVPAIGGEPRWIDMPYRGTSGAWSYRLSLSPDGQSLAFSAADPESPELQKTRVYVISPAGGEPQPLSSSSGSMPAFSVDGLHVAYLGYRERDTWREESGRSRFDSDLWIASASGGEPVRVAAIDGRLRGPVWSPDGRFVAAHYLPGGSGLTDEIWVFPLSADKHAAGDPIKIALPRSSQNIVAGWTKENVIGTFIESESHKAIYTVPALGGRAVQVTAESGWPYYPRWSHDGERIYFRNVQEDETPVVSTVFVPAAGGVSTPVDVRSERWLVSRVPGGGLNVSPRGDRMLMSAYQEPYDSKEGVDVWSVSLVGESPTRLTSDGTFEGYPCWSPDGQRIAFLDRIVLPDDEWYEAIFLMSATGGEQTQITFEGDSLEGGAIAFSPDGERLAFFSDGAIKTISVEGGQPEMLISPVRYSRHSQLVWSPDGSKMAHSVGGRIWTTPLDGGEPEELQTGLPEGAELSEFDWSRDGERIVFLASMGGVHEFWLISDFLP